MRLVDGSSFKEGQLEVYSGGSWNKFCDDGTWTKTDAKVVCKELGFMDGESELVSSK